MPTGPDREPAQMSDKRRIIAFGNSHCVTIPSAILDLLELEKGDEVEITRKDGQNGFEVRVKPDGGEVVREQRDEHEAEADD